MWFFTLIFISNRKWLNATYRIEKNLIDTITKLSFNKWYILCLFIYLVLYKWFQILKNNIVLVEKNTKD